MAVVFFIMLFFLLLLLVIISSTINIDIKKFEFSNVKTEKLKWDYLILIELRFLNCIKILKLELTPQKLKRLNQKVNLKEKLQKINLKEMKKDLPQKVKQLEKQLKIQLEQLHFYLEIGTKDVIITSAMIALIGSFVGILLPKWIKQYRHEKYKYKIMPVYQNQNVIKLSLNCIIQVKVIHIINIIFTLVKKRKESKKHERTSNRRSYDYSYEQY